MFIYLFLIFRTHWNQFLELGVSNLSVAILKFIYDRTKAMSLWYKMGEPGYFPLFGIGTTTCNESFALSKLKC